MKEQWKQVDGFVGYEVSNLGRVRSVDRIRKAAYGRTARVKGVLLQARKNTTNDYLLVRLRKEGKLVHCLVHRLVAIAFVPNPDGLPQVNHKDENPQNNRWDNLEWCDQLYNNHYGTAIERRSITRGKPVAQYTKDGEFIARFVSAREAARSIGKSQAAITRCCLGKYAQAYGFLWKFD